MKRLAIPAMPSRYFFGEVGDVGREEPEERGESDEERNMVVWIAGREGIVFCDSECRDEGIYAGNVFVGGELIALPILESVTPNAVLVGRER